MTDGDYGDGEIEIVEPESLEGPVAPAESGRAGGRALSPVCVSGTPPGPALVPRSLFTGLYSFLIRFDKRAVSPVIRVAVDD
eukprot:3199851-Prymnesium_polylepis.3